MYSLLAVVFFVILLLLTAYDVIFDSGKRKHFAKIKKDLSESDFELLSIISAIRGSMSLF